MPVAHEEGEGQHKADLVDQLCLTFCHLVLLAETSDLQEIDSALQVRITPDVAVIMAFKYFLNGTLWKKPI